MGAATTELPNSQRDGFCHAARRIARAVRDSSRLAVLIVTVSDVERHCATIGHQDVQRLLDEIALGLRSMLRENDELHRLGDRKFTVLLHGLRNQGHVTLAAKKVERVVREVGKVFGDGLTLNSSTGVALCPDHGSDARELLRLAELAALDGRRRGAGISFFREGSTEHLFSEWGMEQRLQQGIEAGDLRLHYQPKIRVADRQIVSAEALMRWQEPEIGPVSPDVFISLAETTGQIVELTHFALQSACRQLAAWQTIIPGLSIAVNVTPSLIQTSDIVEVVRSATSIWGISPEALTLEVTENALMQNQAASHEVMTQIRKLGSRISIDDFGTGYSSLAYLKQIPADELKIDRSFVMGMLTDPGDFKIIEHSIHIARSFGLDIVAEGIESQEMLEELCKLGCDYAQGYFICKPVTPEQFEVFCFNARQEEETPA